MSKKLNWYKLQSMECPSCGNRIRQNILENSVRCTSCVFVISLSKFDEVVKNMYLPKQRPEVKDNSEALNNL